MAGNIEDLRGINKEKNPRQNKLFFVDILSMQKFFIPYAGDILQIEKDPEKIVKDYSSANVEYVYEASFINDPVDEKGISIQNRFIQLIYEKEVALNMWNKICYVADDTDMFNSPPWIETNITLRDSRLLCLYDLLMIKAKEWEKKII